MSHRIISASLSVIMALNTVTLLPANVFAAVGDSNVYEKDGYTVTYKIGNEWDNNRSVTVTLKNTGEESILNWALKYDVGGELYNLWNSSVYSKTDNETIIKNNGYNYEIEPGQSADFGYIVTGAETPIPEDIELCSRRIDVKSGYEVSPHMKELQIVDSEIFEQAQYILDQRSKKNDDKRQIAITSAAVWDNVLRPLWWTADLKCLSRHIHPHGRFGQESGVS